MKLVEEEDENSPNTPNLENPSTSSAFNSHRALSYQHSSPAYFTILKAIFIKVLIFPIRMHMSSGRTSTNTCSSTSVP